MVKESTYATEAREFLERNGIEMRIVFKNRQANRNWNETVLRNRYTVYIRNTNTNEAMRVIFWASVYDTQNNITPSEYDILACLTKYDPGDYEEFCSEFGYEPEIENEFGRLVRNAKAYRIWRACCDEWEKVQRVFGESETLEELRDIS